MAKIIGNTTTTPIAIPDLSQVEYLTDFFKELPEGKSIDELWGYGVYLIEDNTILLISEFPNGYDEVNMQDLTGYEQTMIKPDGSILYRRKEDFGLAWSSWEDCFATKEYVDSVNTKINEIIDSAPEALDTLNELATALNNDPDFATTIVNQLESKADTSYVDSEIAKIDVSDSITVDQTYNPTSENAQSGKAVAEGIGDIDSVLNEIIELQDIYIDSSYGDTDNVTKEYVDNAINETKDYVDEEINKINGVGSDVIVDQIYDPTSENAQSGIAVAEALATIGSLGSGGGDSTSWKLIASGTLEEDVQNYLINKDKDGNSFALNEIFISLVVKQSSQNDGNKFLRVFFNERYQDECYDFTDAMYTGVDIACQLYRYHIPNATNAMAYGMRYGEQAKFKNSVNGWAKVEKINSITLFGGQNAIIGAGTSFEVWGKM